MALFVLAIALGLGGCAKDRPIVDGFFERGGVIYRDREPEAWGSRSTLNVRGLEF